MPQIVKDLQFTEDQLRFIQSKARIKSMCAGIGSGKSWAGAYDLLRRARPGRTYMVAAPISRILRQATILSFIEVAKVLDLYEPANYRKHPEPNCIIRNDAQIFFNTADDPEHLRGPNLSGIWLDEASIMRDKEVYTICLGRLRQGGEVGWLTATFTPKGKRHWTYDVFGKGKPGTECFFSKTSKNEFLDAEFYTDLRREYGSQLAEQELEGNFVDAAGTMFQRHWFPIITACPPLKRKVRAWDLAATPKKERRTDKELSTDPDFTAGALFGQTFDNQYVIVDIKRLRGTPLQVEQLIQQTAILDGKDTAIWMEQEPGSSGLTVIDYYARKILSGYNYHGERSTGTKPVRAINFAANAENGNVKLLDGHWIIDFLDEAEAFPKGKHDDQIDACSLAFNKVSELRQFWIA
jgi:predicted phage terminase large subunit-like protein